MNSRERNLLVILIAVVGGGGLLVGTYQWFFKPLNEVNKQIREVTEKRNDLQDQVDVFLQDRKKLELARTRSLPTNVADATFEYMSVYLQPILNASGMKDVNVTRTSAAEYKFKPTIKDVKTAGHQILTFSVRAQGDLGQLLYVMDKMNQTPYEHRIKTVVADRVDLSEKAKDLNPKLRIDMVIEVLLVANAKTKPGLPPGFDPALAALDHFAARPGSVPLGWGNLASRVALIASIPHPANRKYEEIKDRNIFTGLIPIETKRPAPPPPGPTPTPEPKPRINVPQYVRLVQTVPDAHEAYLRNLVYSSWSFLDKKKSQEFKVVAEPGSDTGYFKIVDQDTNYIFMVGKVLRIQPREVYFQVKDKVYEWDIGQNLYDAMNEVDPITEEKKSRHLTSKQLTALNLQLDASFAASSAEEDTKSKKTSTKKSGFPFSFPKGGTKGKGKN